MAPERRAWGRAGLVFGAVLAADQATKALVRSGLRPGEEHPLGGGFALVHVRNEGVAFGVAAGGQTLVVVLIAVAVAALVAYFVSHAGRAGMWAPTGLLAGGALGNIVDRVHHGAVTDFVKLPFWPAFNLADTAITVGVLVLVLVLERPRRAAARRA